MDLTRTPEKSQRIAHWLEQFGDELFRWALHKTRDQMIAEDLIQDTFLAAFQSFEKFQNKSAPETWLYSILNNKIIDYYRKQTKVDSLVTESQEDQLNSLFDTEGQWREESKPKEWVISDDQLLDDPEFTKVFQGCMKKLPEKWLSCLQLKYMSEKEGPEICQVLDITPSNFWQLLHRAKLQVRICLEHHWFNI